MLLDAKLCMLPATALPLTMSALHAEAMNLRCTPSMYINIDAQIANYHSPFMLHIGLNSVLRWDFRYDTCTTCACVMTLIKPRTRSLRTLEAKLLIQNLSAVQRMLSNYNKLPPTPHDTSRYSSKFRLENIQEGLQTMCTAFPQNDSVANKCKVQA